MSRTSKLCRMYDRIFVENRSRILISVGILQHSWAPANSDELCASFSAEDDL